MSYKWIMRIRNYLIFMELVFLVNAAGCAYFTLQEPGRGEKAETGYKLCDPILNALEIFKIKNGSYPLGLVELKSAGLQKIPEDVNGYPLKYHSENKEYTLEFRYVGPGMNVCTYMPSTKWKCYGYF